MSLLRYFKPSSDTKLPDPRGPLSTTVPSSIAAANAEVKRVIETKENSDGQKRGHYEKFSPELRFQIGKHAAENRVAATMWFYAKKFVLKESSVRTWKNAYTREVHSKRGDITALKSLPEKKRGRPYLLGEELDKQVRAYVTSLRSNGAVVNTAIVMSCAEGIVKSHDSNLLASNGGHILLTKNWGKSICVVWDSSSAELALRRKFQ